MDGRIATPCQPDPLRACFNSAENSQVIVPAITARRRPPHGAAGMLVGAFVVVIVVHIAQVGSIEGATGSIGRILLHSVSAQDGCEGRMPVDVGPNAAVLGAQQAYQAALERAGASDVPHNKQPRLMSWELSRGMNNSLEALGGRVPPERALQLVALTIPLRTSGPMGKLDFEPAPVTADLCR